MQSIRRSPFYDMGDNIVHNWLGLEALADQTKSFLEVQICQATKAYNSATSLPMEFQTCKNLLEKVSLVSKLNTLTIRQ